MISDIKKLLLKDKNKILTVNSIDNILDKTAFALDKGINVIKFELNIDDKGILDYGKKIRQLCSIYNSLFIVSNRADIARILDADGLHLYNNSIDLKYAIDILGHDKIYGTSATSLKEAKSAQNMGFDYVECNDKIIDNNLNIKFLRSYYDFD